MSSFDVPQTREGKMAYPAEAYSALQLQLGIARPIRPNSPRPFTSIFNSPNTSRYIHLTRYVLPSVEDSFEIRVLAHVLDSTGVDASSCHGRISMLTLAEWCASDDPLRLCVLDTQIVIAMVPQIP